MAKDALKTLIRLAKWELDERRRALADLVKFEDSVKAEKRRLIAEKDEQAKVVAAFPDLAFCYDAYINNFIEQQKKLDKTLADVALLIDKARQLLEEAFMTLKTYEISDKNKQAVLKKEEDLKLQKALDEMGLNSYRLQHKTSDGE